MSRSKRATSPWALLTWLCAGAALLMAAWMVPINIQALTPPLLEAAGRETPSLVATGRQWVDLEKPGPASLVLTAARSLQVQKAYQLAVALDHLAGRAPELTPWGGWDPFLEPLVDRPENRNRAESTPVLTFFITQSARRSLESFLSNSRLQGVQAILATRKVDRTKQFVPALRPGGQALDATILLTALLYQGDHVSPALQRELRELTEHTVRTGEMGELETFYIDLLSLGKRFDWIQLTALMSITDSVRTVGEYAHLARLAGDDLAVIYSAALMNGAADPVARYLIEFGRPGLVDLRLSMTYGQGAVKQLLARQVPVNHQAGPSLAPVAMLALLYPKLALGMKYLGFLLGAVAIFRGLDRLMFAPLSGSDVSLRRSSVLAAMAALLLIIATEPFLLPTVHAADFRVSFAVPVLASITAPASLIHESPTFAMDVHTLLSIALFASLQIGMYLICLGKIREIDRQPASPMLKLRLMENEENLFDGGLYLGIGGTATALVLQVLGVIEPNLLAAYSSNLFGITCVALIKIRHVRPYKRRLILEGQIQASSVSGPVHAA